MLEVEMLVWCSFWLSVKPQEGFCGGLFVVFPAKTLRKSNFLPFVFLMDYSETFKTFRRGQLLFRNYLKMGVITVDKRAGGGFRPAVE